MESSMNIQSYPRSLAFGLVLFAAAFGFGGSLACAQEIEPSAALPALEADGNADIAVNPEALFCVAYYGADENCLSEAALVAEEGNEASEIDEVASVVAELAPYAIESDSSSLYGADAIKVAITESVTLAAPGQEAEISEPESTVAELAPYATESDSLSLYGADAIKVAITESVTLAAPGQEAETSESESTSSLPSDATAGEPNNEPELATPAQDGTD
jgi:hypothetical protein